MSRNLRITDAEQLEGMSPHVRRQLEHKFDGNTVPAPRKPVQRPEENAGRLLVEWIDLLVLPNGLRPGLFFYHVPNGLARNATEGGIFKAQGLRKGWPDYCLDLPLGRYHGLRLELKAPDGDKPSAEQLDILARLESVGFKCCVAWGFDDARRDLERYLDIAN
jgi:hypothetical protein